MRYLILIAATLFLGGCRPKTDGVIPVTPSADNRTIVGCMCTYSYPIGNLCVQGVPIPVYAKEE